MPSKTCFSNRDGYQQVGGSLAGLMCGIALKHAGHTVTIVEKGDNVRQSHMAGVCLGFDAERFLERHDRIEEVFSHRCLRAQALQPDLTPKVFVNARRDITSWDTYYFRLRALFDEYTSSFYPSAPVSSATDGKVAYEGLKEVLALDREKDTMVVTTRDRTTMDVSKTEADLVIGADGPDSFIRAKYRPDSRRKYVGYIAWRGTVPEKDVSESTRKIFGRSVTLNLMKRHHLVVYMIPGIDGSLENGERYINFLWYTNETPADLDKIMVDSVDGHRHHNIVPKGRVNEKIWAERQELAKSEPFPAPFLEVVQKIQQPFIQVITDFIAPQVAFEDGKVLLVGDAVSLYRPHTAFSGTQAAFHANSVEDYVAGKLSLQDFQERVLRYARLHCRQSTCFGNFYQSHILVTLKSAVPYLWACAVDRFKAWWRGEDKLLRGWTYVVEKYDDEE